VARAIKSDVQALLEPYAERLSRIATDAWREWMTSDRQYWRAKRSRASFVWEEMIERAHQAFADDPRVRIIPRHETFLFVLDGSLVFRFKKGDRDNAACNIATQATLAFIDPQRELEGIPEASRVDILYIPNTLETAIDDVRVVARNGDRVAWHFSLLGEAEVIAMPMPTPAQATEEAGSERRSLVRPKRAADLHDKIDLTDAE
jgi:hypothetical protein